MDKSLAVGLFLAFLVSLLIVAFFISIYGALEQTDQSPSDRKQVKRVNQTSQVTLEDIE